MSRQRLSNHLTSAQFSGMAHSILWKRNPGCQMNLTECIVRGRHGQLAAATQLLQGDLDDYWRVLYTYQTALWNKLWKSPWMKVGYNQVRVLIEKGASLNKTSTDIEHSLNCIFECNTPRETWVHSRNPQLSLHLYLLVYRSLLDISMPNEFCLKIHMDFLYIKHTIFYYLCIDKTHKFTTEVSWRFSWLTDPPRYPWRESTQSMDWTQLRA